MNAVRQLRCARHPEREAAAKCILCADFFCRECVTEHDGRMLCAKCLKREASMKPSRQRSLFRLPLHLFLAACSALLLWAFFYNGARLLLTVPNHFHQVLPKADENP